MLLLLIDVDFKYQFSQDDLKATSHRLKFSHYLDNQLFTNGVNRQFSNWPSRKIIPKDESSNENKNDFVV